MSPDAVSSFSEAGRTSPTQSVCGAWLFLSMKLISSQFHTLGQNSAGHNFHSVDGVIAGETGATKSSSFNPTTETNMAPTSPGAMSSCSEVERTSSTESVCDVWLFFHMKLTGSQLHPSVASRNSHAVDSSRFVIVRQTDTFGTSRIESSTQARVLLKSFTVCGDCSSPV